MIISGQSIEDSSDNLEVNISNLVVDGSSILANSDFIDF